MAAVVWITFASLAAAHEVFPTIGDMEVVDGRLTFSLEGNFESIVAGIDLEGLQDTETAPGADRYDVLRAMEPAAFAGAVRAFWPTMTDTMAVLVDGAPAALTLDDIIVPEVGNIDLVRQSTLMFSAALPEDAQSMQIDWPAEFGVLVLRQMGVEEGWDGYLTGGLSEEVDLNVGAQMTALQAFARFIPVGVEHIVPLGLDHILFVLGLFFLSTRVRPLVWQVTAFTAAHTVTLALATLGYVNIPEDNMWIVEAIIAASIVYIAVENIFTDGLNPWRPAIIFGFGLLHGLGFASVLGAYGLPDGAVLPALLGFNIGVELGQLLCIAVAFVIVVAALRLTQSGGTSRRYGLMYIGVAVILLPLLLVPISALGVRAVEAYVPLVFMAAALAGLSAACCVVGGKDSYRAVVAMPASVSIALIGAYWVVERVFL
ncbi:hypothetical protein PSJ8397_00410 [Pseudooctadecabacter jejudonensis]|uniref:HupE / UreJ protein n=2 Tax=Pseudooctadecabacter jejudonensis TaxID=1391910 RepID=A0A1Y5RFD2_9RHOB|nr:hypothetical protein PSJ8397_00410 [Pseudooctadecabacter jejudonensis]